MCAVFIDQLWIRRLREFREFECQENYISTFIYCFQRLNFPLFIKYFQRFRVELAIVRKNFLEKREKFFSQGRPYKLFMYLQLFYIPQICLNVFLLSSFSNEHNFCITRNDMTKRKYGANKTRTVKRRKYNKDSKAEEIRQRK